MTADKKTHLQSRQSFSELVLKYFTSLDANSKAPIKIGKTYTYVSFFKIDSLRKLYVSLTLTTIERIRPTYIGLILYLAKEFNTQKVQEVKEYQFYFAAGFIWDYCTIGYELFDESNDLYVERNFLHMFEGDDRTATFSALRCLYEDYIKLCDMHDKLKKDT